MYCPIEIKPLPAQLLPDPCEADFEQCKKCNRLGDIGNKEKGITRCTRFQNDYQRDDYCPRCGMSPGRGGHRCAVSKNHFEIA